VLVESNEITLVRKESIGQYVIISIIQYSGIDYGARLVLAPPYSYSVRL
jgi:hypothetical protein